jgi:selenocysteine-specific elongation factor
MSLIIAVAGHIDHGKTALVRALTGIETDRLPEERQRGISIEAGFAHWRRAKTDDQPRVSFVDVPGHERYIGNMLAGIQGARAALLVIAADDGVMPQTREHAEILSLMGVRNWVVALTKSDLLDAAQLAHRIASVQTWLTSEAINAEVIPVSAHTGAGIALLTSRIEVLALIEQRRTEPDTEPKTEHTARLCVDKSFIASGDGLVVTGLLISGVLRVGDTVRVSPSGQAARVRGLQVAGQAVGEARSGSRCAINLAGSGIDRQSAGRGDWIVSSELHHPVRVVDVKVHGSGALAGKRASSPTGCEPVQGGGTHQSIRLPADIRVYAGTARFNARVSAFSAPPQADGPQPAWVRLLLSQPVSAVVGDRWILRSSDGSRTLGMAEVVWPVDATDGLRRSAQAEWLKGVSLASPASWLASALARLPGGIAPERFAAAWALTHAAANDYWLSAGAAMVRQTQVNMLFDQTRLDEIRGMLLTGVETWQKQNPESLGIEWTALVGTLKRRDRRHYAAVALSALQAAGALIRHGDRIFSPGHVPLPSAADLAFRLRALPMLAERRSRSIHELIELLGMPLVALRLALDRLALQGYAVAITPQRYLAVPQIEALAAAAISIAATGELRAGDFSRATGIGRNLGIDVLEFFDRIRLTRRVGDRRIVIDAQALGRVLRSDTRPTAEVA